ncbi:thioesterase II family protein [Streptacidiphilus monticola]
MTRYLQAAAVPDTRLRLFCFPYAGGGASTYAGWQRRLGSRVQVLPVQLPGRESRSGEPRFTDLGALVRDLDRELADELDFPHILLGHSMGALIAYALARHRAELGERLPEALVLSAYRAPTCPPRSWPGRTRTTTNWCTPWSAWAASRRSCWTIPTGSPRCCRWPATTC